MEIKTVPEEPIAVKEPETDVSRSFVNGDTKQPSKLDTKPAPRKYVVPSNPRKILTEGEADKILKALAIIEDAAESDVEGGGWLEHKERFKQRSRKRAADVLEVELRKRKVSDFLSATPGFH